MVDLCRSRAVPCVCAGGIFDGRGLAAALSLGACGVWVGTRFICAQEAAAPRAHKEKVLRAESVDTMRTLVISGRPLRLIPNDWVRSWEEEPEKIKDFCQRGVIPLESRIGRGGQIRNPDENYDSEVWGENFCSGATLAGLGGLQVMWCDLSFNYSSFTWRAIRYTISVQRPFDTLSEMSRVSCDFDISSRVRAFLGNRTLLWSSCPGSAHFIIIGHVCVAPLCASSALLQWSWGHVG